MSLESNFEKIKLLGPGACYDTCGPKDFGVMGQVPGVYEAVVSGGRTCRLFKVLQSNVCVNNCTYCAHRRDSNVPRAVLTPSELAESFMHVYKHQLVEGAFFSSGITDNSEASMTRLVETAQLLRFKFGYTGYLHLKIMPGVSLNLIEQAVLLADRVSLNLEVPDEKYIKIVSPEKDFNQELLQTLAKLNIIRSKLKEGQIKPKPGKNWRQRRCGWKKRFGNAPSITSQFVVGAAGESDRELIRAAQQLQRNFGLYRIFFSAFRPITYTPLENRPPTPQWREHRLYQAEWLVREYGFSWEEIPFDANDYLFKKADPKEIWAKNHPEFFPIDIKKADCQKLLRVPGIGPNTAKKIVRKQFFKLPKKTQEYLSSGAYGQLRWC